MNVLHGQVIEAKALFVKPQQKTPRLTPISIKRMGGSCSLDRYPQTRGLDVGPSVGKHGLPGAALKARPLLQGALVDDGHLVLHDVTPS